MESFASDNPPPRLKRARHYVQRVAMKQSFDNNGLLRKFISVCPQLRSLALWSLPAHAELCLLSLLHLQKLTFGKTFDKDISFSSSLFHFITHLELVSYPTSGWEFLWAKGLANMSGLTHLVLDATEITPQRGSLLPFVSDASDHMPSNLFVLLLYVDARQPAPDDDIYDEKIILAIRDRPIAGAHPIFPFVNLDWDGWTGEPETLWIKAELILEQKKKQRG
ncbi:hypothetical protein DL96DRAFT_1824693 [Flagelloscypha sp. PMI_526]|nr:hypothetical protein DL96DRAFT_1824693 [Flagelloscypha sp. PMI_526]